VEHGNLISERKESGRVDVDEQSLLRSSHLSTAGALVCCGSIAEQGGTGIETAVRGQAIRDTGSSIDGWEACVLGPWLVHKTRPTAFDDGASSCGGFNPATAVTQTLHPSTRHETHQ
jgi:hypothetical protein